jgi:hypothetical protein
MAYAHVSFEAIHMCLPENIPNKAIVFSEMKPVTFTGNDTSRILPTVL